MKQPSPGLYWFSRPNMEPMICEISEDEIQKYICFKVGDKPLRLNNVAEDSIFVPAHINPNLVPWIQKYPELYQEMAKFYEIQNLSVWMCTLYLKKHNKEAIKHQAAVIKELLEIK